MPIHESFLNQIKCCLSKERHYAHEPILMKCGANACKRCINESQSQIKECSACYNCNQMHNKFDYKDAPINKMVETFINFHLKDLIQELNVGLASIKDSLTGL